MSDDPKGSSGAGPAHQATLLKGDSGSGSKGSRGSHAPSSVPTQNLLQDRILERAPRTEFMGQMVPNLNGIILQAKLGEGGMGAVYLGLKPLLKQEVAVKVVHSHLVDHHPANLQRFIREAQIAAQISSPHIINCSDINETNGLHFLVMEYVYGDSASTCLKKIIAANKIGFDEATALDICIAATEGLAVAHREGIVHRDIKPDNIMVLRDRKSGEYRFPDSKLADLGLARAEADVGMSLTGPDSMMGTLGYMSPEQARNARKAGKPADVFSMGATLYALLTTVSPFRGESATEVILAIMNGKRVPLQELRPDVSAPTVALVERCLALEAENRYMDGVELLQALKDCRSKLVLTDDLKAGSQAIQTILQQQPYKAPSSTLALSASKVSADIDFPKTAPSAPAAPTSKPGTVVINIPTGKSAVVAVACVVLVVAAALFFALNGKSQNNAAVGPPAAAATLEIGLCCDEAKEAFLRWAADRFHNTPNGKNIAINVIPKKIGEVQAQLIKGNATFNMWAPTDEIQLMLLSAEMQKHQPNTEVIYDYKRIAMSPLVIVMFKDRYEAFSKKYGDAYLKSIGKALADGGKWSDIANKREWGTLSVTFTNPNISFSGLSSALVLCALQKDSTSPLTAKELQTPEMQKWLHTFESAFAFNDTQVQALNNMLVSGPSAFDVITASESLVISRMETLKANEEGFKIIYPVYTVWSDNPVCIFDVPWNTPEKKAAGKAFTDFLLSTEAQEKLVTLGFRPVDTAISLKQPSSPWLKYSAEGIDLHSPPRVQQPEIEVIRKLLDSLKHE